MPQHLFIEKDGKPVGHLRTGNRGGTRYDVVLEDRATSKGVLLRNVDTGVESQPQDPQLQKEDFRSDFIHARRLIAATVVTSEQFHAELAQDGTSDSIAIHQLEMRLLTNAYDRGTIQVYPVSGAAGKATVELTIGSGPTRPPGAIPGDPVVFVEEVVEIFGTTSPLVQALEILRKAGPAFVAALSREIDQG